MSKKTDLTIYEETIIHEISQRLISLTKKKTSPLTRATLNQDCAFDIVKGMISEIIRKQPKLSTDQAIDMIYNMYGTQSWEEIGLNALVEQECDGEREDLLYNINFDKLIELGADPSELKMFVSPSKNIDLMMYSIDDYTSNLAISTQSITAIRKYLKNYDADLLTAKDREILKRKGFSDMKVLLSCTESDLQRQGFPFEFYSKLAHKKLIKEEAVKDLECSRF